VSHDITYLSLGAGVQSSALLIMSAKEMYGCPRADHAIFADTGDEPAWVYEQLERLKAWVKPYGIPIHTARKGVLSEDLLRRAGGEKVSGVGIPAHVKNDDGTRGMLMRTCTVDYKILPIERKVRELLGLKKGERAKGRVSAVSMLGISTDEATRAKPSRTAWIRNTYPLLDAGINREGCERIVENEGLPKPQKSACYYCPFHDDSYWMFLRDERPDVFARAVDFDAKIRDLSKASVTQPAYLHSSLVPLDQVKFKHKAKQKGLDFFFQSDCEGMCGV